MKHFEFVPTVLLAAFVGTFLYLAKTDYDQSVACVCKEGIERYKKSMSSTICGLQTNRQDIRDMSDGVQKKLDELNIRAGSHSSSELLYQVE
ncbi:MAG: hypothetical protein ACI33O_05385, partial [Bhargavaea sp.]